MSDALFVRALLGRKARGDPKMYDVDASSSMLSISSSVDATGRRTAVSHRKLRHLANDSRSRSWAYGEGKRVENERRLRRVIRVIFQCCCLVHLAFADPSSIVGNSTREVASCGNNLFHCRLARDGSKRKKIRKKGMYTGREQACPTFAQ